MATETIEKPAQAHPARRLALDPYVTRVRSWCLDNERTGRHQQISLRLGFQTLTFEPPEFAMMLRSARAGEETPAGEDVLPLETLGWLTKSHEDLANLRSLKDPTSRAVFALQAELMLDSALGAALLAELESRIEELTLFEDDRSAGALTQLREFLHATVSEVSATISGSERERAGELASSLTDRPLAPARTGAPAPPQQQRAVRQERAPAKEAAVAAPKPTRAAVSVGSGRREVTSTAFLGIALVLALAIWLGLFVMPRFSGPAIEPLTISDFDDSIGLSDVEARPPSMFVQVDRDRWRSLDEAGRLAVVEDVAHVLARKNYTGALFETGEGRPVAQWLRDRGTQLIGEPVDRESAIRPIAAE